MAESINQSMHIYIVPCVACESVAQNKTKSNNGRLKQNKTISVSFQNVRQASELSQLLIQAKMTLRAAMHSQSSEVCSLLSL